MGVEFSVFVSVVTSYIAIGKTSKHAISYANNDANVLFICNNKIISPFFRLNFASNS